MMMTFGQRRMRTSWILSDVDETSVKDSSSLGSIGRMVMMLLLFPSDGIVSEIGLVAITREARPTTSNWRRSFLVDLPNVSQATPCRDALPIRPFLIPLLLSAPRRIAAFAIGVVVDDGKSQREGEDGWSREDREEFSDDGFVSEGLEGREEGVVGDSSNVEEVSPFSVMRGGEEKVFDAK